MYFVEKTNEFDNGSDSQIDLNNANKVTDFMKKKL